uniref:(northern house mosquito) hypothetical protein n=1 Tax=Culex pipiens TaxID=7175 RepID=A0A8D8CRN9_CULPI
MHPLRTLCYRYPPLKSTHVATCASFIYCAPNQIVLVVAGHEPGELEQSESFFFVFLRHDFHRLLCGFRRERKRTRRAERWIVSICQFPEAFWQTPGNSLLVDVM